ncbi:MAG: FAD-dependent monooxygenase [Balneolaceae bacterium]|nr:MAG: FAD-dependent monooxygenase [Balneolaceae bacterium]
MNKDVNIVIAGGGPVGLFLAGRLIQFGFHCTLLENKPKIDRHSKSLGIHPVSLELFNRAGIADQFIEQAINIRRGIAFWNRDKIGEISFARCPKPFNFVLALPQWQTETILENWVHSLRPGTIVRGAEVTNITQSDHSVSVTYHQHNSEKTMTADFLVGCDGKNSNARKLAGIPFNGKPYPDTYIMGDFTDNTRFGTDAAVYLHHDGLIESFPLPGNMRRWVAKTESLIEEPKAEMLRQIIEQRTGHSLTTSENVMMSGFGVQHYLADVFHSGRVLLSGDAAHVISPIGGQGMNLGWLDAEACAQIFVKAADRPSEISRLIKTYTTHQKKIAIHAAKRAEMNMWLGRKENSGFTVKMAAHLITKKPLSHLLARVFTMRGLGSWWI